MKKRIYQRHIYQRIYQRDPLQSFPRLRLLHALRSLPGGRQSCRRQLGEHFFGEDFLPEVGEQPGGEDDEERPHGADEDGLQVGDAGAAGHHAGQPPQDPVDAQHHVRLALLGHDAVDDAEGAPGEGGEGGGDGDLDRQDPLHSAHTKGGSLVERNPRPPKFF